MLQKILSVLIVAEQVVNLVDKKLHLRHVMVVDRFLKLKKLLLEIFRLQVFVMIVAVLEVAMIRNVLNVRLVVWSGQLR